MRLQDKKVIALVEEEFEDLELWYPILRRCLIPRWRSIPT